MKAPTAEQLLDNALEVPFQGWNFSVLGNRIMLAPPPWGFERLVDEDATQASSMLDMGTGGGEWLSLRAHAPRTVATESWRPNVSIAAARLRALHILVVEDEGAVDNVNQKSGHIGGRLPFRRAAFDLVVNRHEAFAAPEVHEVLRPEGVFLTQQASSGTEQFHRLLDLESPPTREFHLDLAIEQLEQGGFRVDQSGVGIATTTFADIGALAWYLRNVPWAVPDFSIEQHRDALLALHGEPIVVASERFWLRAIA